MTDDKRDEARARATPSRRIAAGKAPRFVHHPDPNSDAVEFFVESRIPGVPKVEQARRATAANAKTRWPSPSELYSEPSSHPPLKHAGAAAYREELLTKSPDELSELCEQVQKQKEQERLAHQASILSENSVWGKPHTWPSRDPAGYVFFGRAVGEIGKALFGDEWTGDETPASLPFMREGRLVTKRLSESEKEEAVARWESAGYHCICC